MDLYVKTLLLCEDFEVHEDGTNTIHKIKIHGQ